MPSELTVTDANLLPCPVCGKPSIVLNQICRGVGASGMETPQPYVQCTGCGLRTKAVACDDSPYGQRRGAKSYSEARRELIAAWNTRAAALAPYKATTHD